MQADISKFARDIKLGKFERSYDVAKKTVSLLSAMTRDNKWETARNLMVSLQSVCDYIDGLGLVETAAGNMTRRIMRIVRDECHNFQCQSNQQQSKSQDTGDSGSSQDDIHYNETNLDMDLTSTGVLENILEAIDQELMNEIELSSRTIARQAIDYVQSDDIILTLGKSKVIETFLRYAAIGSKSGKRKFSVFVVELAPFYSGREMAKLLGKSNISTLIIPDSAVFANMCRVSKVIIGCHSMMADGGIKAPAGSHSIALAAKHYSVPLIVCCPIYKLTPEYLVSHDSSAFRQFSNLHAAYPEPYISRASFAPQRQLRCRATSETESILTDHDEDEDDSFCDIKEKSKEVAGNMIVDETIGKGNSIESLHSIFDYVPPELISLFVSNIGGNSPSYVYQLLNELYCKLA